MRAGVRQERTGAAGAGIRLVEGDDLVLSARTESLAGVMGNVRVKTGKSLSGRVVTTGLPVAVEDLGDDSIADPMYRSVALGRGLRGFLAVPLRAHGRIIGVLSLFNAGRRRFDSEEVSLLSAFADYASPEQQDNARATATALREQDARSGLWRGDIPPTDNRWDDAPQRYVRQEYIAYVSRTAAGQHADSVKITGRFGCSKCGASVFCTKHLDFESSGGWLPFL